MVAYWVVLSIQTAYRNYARFQERAQAALRSDLRASQLETQVAQARLGALKAQLQPHFLFNTLNAIVVLVRQQKGQQAEETLARFSDLLRAVLADMDAQEVTLARELEYLQALPVHRAAALLRPAARRHRRRPGAARRGRAAHGPAAHRRECDPPRRRRRAPRPASSRSARARIGDSLTRDRARRRSGLSRRRAPGTAWAWDSPIPARGCEQLYGADAELRTETRPEGGALVTLVLPFHLVEEQR